MLPWHAIAISLLMLVATARAVFAQSLVGNSERPQSTGGVALALSRAGAQPLAPVAVQPSTDDARQLFESGQGRRAWGISLTIVGSLLVAGGVATAAYGVSQEYRCESSGTCGGMGYKLAGVAGMLGGLASLGVGIPLWAIGVHRIRQAERMGYRSATLVPFVAPTSGGAVAGIRVAEF